jgi:hypothetical protein
MCLCSDSEGFEQALQFLLKPSMVTVNYVRVSRRLSGARTRCAGQHRAQHVFPNRLVRLAKDACALAQPICLAVKPPGVVAHASTPVNTVRIRR